MDKVDHVDQELSRFIPLLSTVEDRAVNNVEFGEGEQDQVSIHLSQDNVEAEVDKQVEITTVERGMTEVKLDDELVTTAG